MFVLAILVMILFFNKKIINLVIPKQQVSNNTGVNAQVNTSSIKITPSLDNLNEIEKTSIDKNDWQTYKNDYYGFEIRAPKSWSIKSSNKTGLLENENSTDISTPNLLAILPGANSDPAFYAPIHLYVKNNPNNLSIIDWMREAYSNDSSNWQERLAKLEIPTTEEAAALYMGGLYGPGVYDYYIKKDNKIYYFGAVDSNSDMINGDAMMYTIVKTLRFK